MSRLEELIAELCPNGVKFYRLGDVAEISTGSSNSNEEESDGVYPFFVRSRDIKRKNSWEYDETAIITAGDGEVGKIYHYIEGKYALHQRAYRIHIINEKVYTKFIYYYMMSAFYSYITKEAVSSSVMSLRRRMFENFVVPVPPLPVQEEIVRILDKFAELTAELTTRRQQYQYYMNKLLSFDDSVPVVQLSDIFDFKNGLNKGKEFFGRGDYIVKYMDVYKHCALTEGDLSDRVEVTDSEKDKVSAKKGDVFFTRTSESREEIGFASVLLDEVEGCVFSGFLIRARQKTQKLLPKYCAYCFKAESVREQITRNCIFTTRASLSGANLGLVKLPVPPLEEQKRIVAILDRFDALCNDLTSGLPAEIEARKKQYEYYRDKLLTFKEAV